MSKEQDDDDAYRKEYETAQRERDALKRQRAQPQGRSQDIGEGEKGEGRSSRQRDDRVQERYTTRRERERDDDRYRRHDRGLSDTGSNRGGSSGDRRGRYHEYRSTTSRGGRYRDLDNPSAATSYRTGAHAPVAPTGQPAKKKHKSGLLSMLKEQIKKEAQHSSSPSSTPVAIASQVVASGLDGGDVTPPRSPRGVAPTAASVDIPGDTAPVKRHVPATDTTTTTTSTTTAGMTAEPESTRTSPTASTLADGDSNTGRDDLVPGPSSPEVMTEADMEVARISALLNGCRHVDLYKKLNRIAEGTFGVVYRAQNKKTGEIVALKRVKLEHGSEGFPIVFIREMKILVTLDHVNVLTAKEIVVGNHLDAIFIVMPYMDHDVKYLMDCMRQPFQQNEVKCLMLQLLRGMKYMHDNWTLHRDLKPSNLLINHDGILKIADLGLAREYGSPLQQYTQLVVTLWYRAPELLLEAGMYSSAVDMWSVGCIFAELLNKEPLITGRNELSQITKIFEVLGTPNDEIWPGFSELPMVKKLALRRKQGTGLRAKLPFLSEAGHDLLRGLLHYDPQQRYTADEALNHPYFQESPRAIDPSLIPTHPERHEKREKDTAKEMEREMRKQLLGNQRGAFPGVGDANVGPGRGFTLKLG